MLALFSAGTGEVIMIVFLALLLFGRRLPEVMRSLGQGVHQFKRGLRDVEGEIESAGEHRAGPHSDSSSSTG
jgi:sec-independent protein translocase protein TatA